MKYPIASPCSLQSDLCLLKQLGFMKNQAVNQGVPGAEHMLNLSKSQIFKSSVPMILTIVWLHLRGQNNFV